MFHKIKDKSNIEVFYCLKSALEVRYTHKDLPKTQDDYKDTRFQLAILTI